MSWSALAALVVTAGVSRGATPLSVLASFDSTIDNGEAVSLLQAETAMVQHSESTGGGMGHLAATSDGRAVASSHTAATQRSQGMLLWVLRPPAGHTVTGAVRPPEDNATCNGSGYFIDWGSSGMKVYRVHQAEALKSQHAVPGSLDAFRLSGMSIHTQPGALRAALNELAEHLIGKAAPGAVLGTAGMRLDPEEADTLWAVVRDWARTHPGFLGRCGKGSDNTDCRTLAGSQEARYEMLSALHSETGRELAKSSEPFGFASAGGASMQVGLRGAKAQLHQCLSDLGNLDTHFDSQRADVVDVNGAPTLVLSFLSLFDLKERECSSGACDYDVGGLDQMRARFDEFLQVHGDGRNPCLSEHAKLQPSRSCRFFGKAECIVDRYGGKISSLPPAPASLKGARRKEACRLMVKSFMEEDLVLSHWTGSAACSGLASGADKWALLTSFAREAQLGTDVVHDWESFTSVQQAALDLDFPSAEAVAQGEEGIVLSSMLLVHFLETLGVRPSAKVRGMQAEWAMEAMRERGLVQGWPLPGFCSAGTTDAPRSCVLAIALTSALLRSLGWRG
mmetsp:Transcript_13917/g.32619  ORF Transcript_13917/g.32619 Transcript_13917/m.32619 type:complete len:565 (+) Transcript_13917:55-1749(+)